MNEENLLERVLDLIDDGIGFYSTYYYCVAPYTSIYKEREA